MSCFSTFFKVTLLALGQSYDCPSASEVTLKDMGKIDHCPTKHNEAPTLCTVLGTYSVTSTDDYDYVWWVIKWKTLENCLSWLNGWRGFSHLQRLPLHQAEKWESLIRFFIHHLFLLKLVWQLIINCLAIIFQHHWNYNHHWGNLFILCLMPFYFASLKWQSSLRHFVISVMSRHRQPHCMVFEPGLIVHSELRASALTNSAKGSDPLARS